MLRTAGQAALRPDCGALGPPRLNLRPWRVPALILGVALACMITLAVATLRHPTTSNFRALAWPRGPQSRVARPQRMSLISTALPSIGASEHSFWPLRRGNSLLTQGGGIHGTFLDSGPALRVPQGTLALSLAAVGRGERFDSVSTVAPTNTANQVLYNHGSIIESYRNGPYGLEQDFTVRHRPRIGGTGSDKGSLVLALRMSGSLVPEQVGSQILFRTHTGATALRYGQLDAVDATGRRLPAHIEVVNGVLQLRIDDRHARYPLGIDPFIQLGEKLTGGGEVGNGYFGESVAASSNGDTVLVGAPGSGVPYSGEGGAWVFTRSGSTWTEQAQLKGSEEIWISGEPSPAPGSARFGASVALSSDGSTAVVGGPNNSELEGAAWVFTRSGSTWTQQAELRGFFIGGVMFGESIALSSDGNTLLISDGALPVVAVFTRSDSIWTRQFVELEGEAAGGDAVSLSGDGNTALVSVVLGGCCGKERTSAVEVFVRTGEAWTKQAELPGHGGTLSYDGNTALIGDHFFTRSGSTWTQQAELPFSGGTPSNDGNTVLSGNRVFKRSGEAWALQSELMPSGESGESHFGSTAALSPDGNTALIGGPGDDGGLGAAWVFVREPPTITTRPASSIMQTSSTLNALVNPNSETVSECSFEYGTTESYGASVQCSSLPGSGSESVEVSASATGLDPSTTYHYRITATNPGGTSHGADQKFTTLGPPDFGRCVKVPAEKQRTKAIYHGRFTTGTCVAMSPTMSGKYEWDPGVVKTHFSTMLKEGTVTFETVKKVKLTCKAESGAGTYSGTKEVADTVLRLAGCESLGERCTTPGLAEGELETKTLEGTLGWKVKTTKRVALDLYPVGKTGVVMEYRCIGGVPIALSGSILVPVTVDKMLGTTTLKYKASKGKQKPEAFEGESAGVLTASLNGEASEQIGVTATVTQVNEEAVEINALA